MDAAKCKWRLRPADILPPSQWPRIRKGGTTTVVSIIAANSRDADRRNIHANGMDILMPSA